MRLGRALEKFWSPVPWMLEGAIALELIMGKFVEATVIGVLLVFNAGLSYFQEGRAQATLAALKSRLAITASVRRDGIWKLVPAAELVPGDVVKLSLGGLVPADAKIRSGEVLLDQSLLTGESAAVEAGDGFPAYAGALIRRGEAVAEVSATGARTKFGRTAELVARRTRRQHAAKYSLPRRTQYRRVQRRPRLGADRLRILSSDADRRNRFPHSHGGLGVDTGRAARDLHARSGARRAQSRQARRAPHAAFRRGRSRNNGRPVRRQDRHPDAKRTHCRADTADGIVHRSRCALGRRVRKRRRRTRSRGPRHPRGRCAKGGAAKFKLVSFAPFDPAKRMSEATVTRLERRNSAHREGRVRNRDRPHRSRRRPRKRRRRNSNRRACA